MKAILAWTTAHYDVLKDFAGPVVTFFAAVVAGLITLRFGQVQARIATYQANIAKQQADTAKQQADLAKVRLKHDLFDRRFAVYEAARGLLEEVTTVGDASNQALYDFAVALERATFLFTQPVNDYLHEFHEQAWRLHDANVLLSRHHRDDAVKSKADSMHWLRDQYNVLVQQFREPLALDENTATRAPPLRRVPD